MGGFGVPTREFWCVHGEFGNLGSAWGVLGHPWEFGVPMRVLRVCRESSCVHRCFGVSNPSPFLTGPVCPPNQHYELCGPPCPATCQGEAGPQDCSDASTCSEGCFCDSGFFRSGDHCVPLPQCGCVLEGRYYPRGVQFYPEPPCTQRCICSENGELECHPTPGCSRDEECTVRDGVLGCHPRTCRQCQVLGAGAYSTFDGHLGSLGGSCTLPLLELERGEPEEELEPITVALEQEDAEVQRVTVMAHGVTVVMDRGQQWEVTVSRGPGDLGVQALVLGAKKGMEMGFWEVQQ